MKIEDISKNIIQSTQKARTKVAQKLEAVD